LLYLGTSGWNYAHWKRTFYPKEVTQKLWLEFYAQRFQTVELNNSFYRLPSPEQFASWRDRSPADFIFTVKMSRFLTHVKRLREPQEPVERFLTHVAPLGKKLGPILMQFPPTFKIDLGALEETLALFPDDKRVVVEFRHDSWFTEETLALCEKFGVAWCLADRLSKPITPVWRSTDWAFLRFHEGLANPHPCYGRSALQTWVERLRQMHGTGADIYVYFNNDPRACALKDARTFGRMAQRAGFDVTRTPGPHDVTIDLEGSRRLADPRVPGEAEDLTPPMPRYGWIG
jgi:uncharacterized protein YecE (DUF72 family)